MIKYFIRFVCIFVCIYCVIYVIDYKTSYYVYYFSKQCLMNASDFNSSINDNYRINNVLISPGIQPRSENKYKLIVMADSLTDEVQTTINSASIYAINKENTHIADFVINRNIKYLYNEKNEIIKISRWASSTDNNDIVAVDFELNLNKDEFEGLKVVINATVVNNGKTETRDIITFMDKEERKTSKILQQIPMFY